MPHLPYFLNKKSYYIKKFRLFSMIVINRKSHYSNSYYWRNTLRLRQPHDEKILKLWIRIRQNEIRSFDILTFSLSFILKMNTACSTCLEVFTSKSDISTTPCGHVFHTNCITKWLENGQNPCSECRKECSANEIIKLYFSEG